MTLVLVRTCWNQTERDKETRHLFYISRKIAQSTVRICQTQTEVLLMKEKIYSLKYNHFMFLQYTETLLFKFSTNHFQYFFVKHYHVFRWFFTFCWAWLCNRARLLSLRWRYTGSPSSECNSFDHDHLCTGLSPNTSAGLSTVPVKPGVPRFLTECPGLKITTSNLPD